MATTTPSTISDENGITASSAWSGPHSATGAAASGSGAAAMISRRSSSTPRSATRAGITSVRAADGQRDLALQRVRRRARRLAQREEALVLLAVDVVVRAARHQPPVGHDVVRAALLEPGHVEVPRVHEGVDEHGL